MMQTSERVDGGAQAVLSRLPEFEPDAMLWSRIVAARAGQQRAARRRRLGWIGGALAAASAAFVILPRIAEIDPVSDDLARWQQQSQALEQQWQANAHTPGDARTRAELRLIDGALQSAYDRGAASSELVPLWKQRNEVLHSLITSEHRRVAVTRI